MAMKATGGNVKVGSVGPAQQAYNTRNVLFLPHGLVVISTAVDIRIEIDGKGLYAR